VAPSADSPCDNDEVNPWFIAPPAALTAAAITAYGAVFPRSELFGKIICRTNSARKLAITFDDGPNPAITPELLDILEQYEAHATFFVIGQFASDCPDLLREIARRGHAIGNHTDRHANLLWRTPTQIHQQIQHCNETIGAITGDTPKWFRPPFGLRNPWVIPTARKLGQEAVLWTRLPGDWRDKPASWLINRMEPIAKRAQSAQSCGGNSSATTGDILCLHDGDHRFLNGNRRNTLTALKYWLPRWRDLGLEFVTIDEAVRIPAK
jgi:peptidoglycan/xylan/chitin deacetylase (PgdA/CDA1 family)